MLFIAWRQSYDVLREAGHFVNLFFDGHTRSQVIELNGPGRLGEDREGEGVPLGEDLPVDDLFAVLNAKARSVNDVVALFLAILLFNYRNDSGAIDGDRIAVTDLDEIHVRELNDTVVACFERRT